MKSLAYIPASNQATNASQMTVQSVRSPGASDIIVNTVTGAPAKFYASMGAPHTFVDPVTGEQITIISEATAVDFAGHLDSGKVVIDVIAPGYVDTRGSLSGDIVVIRPVTEWANNIFNTLSQSLQDDGKLKETAFDYDPNITEHVVSGGIWALVSGLNGSMTTLTAYITGRLNSVAALASRAFTASKDTYVDVLRNTTTGLFTLVYQEVSNGATAPTLAPNSFRLAKVVTSGAAITSVVQLGSDGIGNLFRPVGAASTVSLKNPVRFRVARNASAAYSGAGQTYIPDVKVFDTANAFNLATGEFTAPYDGNYDFSWLTQMSGSSVTGAYPTLNINGANYFEYGQSITNGVPSGMSLNALDVPLKAGDKVLVQVVCNSSFNSIPSNSNGRPNGFYNWFSGRLASRS